MYCGDETGAFVGDCGLTSSRFGFGGEDCPKLVLPSYVKKSLSSSSEASDISSIFSYPKSSLSLSPHIPSEEDYVNNCTGIISSFDAWEAIWEKSFSTLNVRSDASSTPHPILAVDDSVLLNSRNASYSENRNPVLKPGTARYQREKMLELFFEKWDVPAVFIAPSPMLEAFSMGRQTALVLDMGGGGCRATPVIDGLVCHMSQRKSGRGGEWLSEMQLEILRQVNKVSNIKSRDMLKKERKNQNSQNIEKVCNDSILLQRLSMLDLMYEMKTSDHINVPESTWDSDNGMSQYPTKKQKKSQEQGLLSVDQDVIIDDKKIYELPDGTTVDLDTSPGGGILCDLPELLFCNDPLYCAKLSSEPNKKLFTDPIQKIVYNSISSVDIDARKELCGNIILCGAHSLFPNLDKRLSHEISNIVSNYFKCRVTAPRNSTERRFASWIGGSVLTSLGSFQQLWLSKTEYEEYGATLACQRLP